MNPNLTDIIIVLDRSSSMEAIRKETVTGFNTFVATQKNVTGEADLTLVAFAHEYQEIYRARRVHQVSDLTPESYRPNGWTALLGAIGLTIERTGERLKATPNNERPSKVIFVVITDGEENSSHKYLWSRPYDGPKVKGMIEHQTNVYKWEFVFIGANQDAFLTAHNLGVSMDNALQYTANPIGTEALYRCVADNAASYRVGTSASMAFTNEDRRKQQEAIKKDAATTTTNP